MLSVGDKVILKGETQVLTIKKIEEYKTKTKRVGEVSWKRLFFVEPHPTASDFNVWKVIENGEVIREI